MIETVKDRVSISQLMRDLNLEVVYMPEKEEYFVESEDVNRTGLPLAGYFEYFPYERIQIIGKTEYTYFQNISKKEREEVFRTCDYITVHVPLLDDTKEMINADTCFNSN